MKTRRDFLAGSASLAVLAGSLSPLTLEAEQSAVETHSVKTLPPLPYAPDALEPFIDAQTMSLHHDKHHKAYVDNLNKALGPDSKLADSTVEQLVADVATLPDTMRIAVRNQGGGHANHSLWWPSLKNGGPQAPAAELAKDIDTRFASFSAFQEQFTKAALGTFGSGWAWLLLDKKGVLSIESTANQDSPLMDGKYPVFGIDVWEHAYYLKYQNRRPEYVKAFWNVVNWDYVSGRYAGLQKMLPKS